MQLLEAYLGLGNVTELLGASEDHLTVLMPRDKAFETLNADLVSRLQSPQWRAHLQDLLRYHIFNGRLSPSELEETQTLIMANGEPVVLTRRAGTSRIRANGSLILAIYEASDGLALMLDDVLRPSWLALTLLDVMQGSATSFSSLVVQAEVDSYILDAKVAFTIFVPSNDALVDMSVSGILSQSVDGSASLRAIVSNHIVPSGPIPLFGTAASISVETLSGGLLEVIDSNPPTIEGVVKKATAVQTNRVAMNGIVHIVDTVLLGSSR